SALDRAPEQSEEPRRLRTLWIERRFDPLKDLTVRRRGRAQEVFDSVETNFAHAREGAARPVHGLEEERLVGPDSLRVQSSGSNGAHDLGEERALVEDLTLLGADERRDAQDAESGRVGSGSTDDLLGEGQRFFEER